jgi:outer membrane protein OmpA-like peptidoglycan-associated protein
MALPGILIVFGAICGGFAMAGGHFPVLIQPSEFVVILGAAVGTLITSAPGLMKKRVMHAFKAALKDATLKKSDYLDLLKCQYELFMLARRQGVLALGILIEAVDQDKGLLFDLSSAKLKEPLERFLRAISPALTSSGAPIEINGHTDARPFVGTKMSNWDLSYQRAAAAREILEGAGIQASQIAGVFARGSSQPYDKDSPLSRRTAGSRS